VIIREICSQPVGQGPCELVVCVASEKHFPIAAYPALESSDCHRSQACVFVWACLKIDFGKRLDFLKKGQISVEEFTGGDLSYIRSPRNAACQQGFGRVLHSQEVFEHDRTNCMRHFCISHYFAELDEMHMLLTAAFWCRGKGPHPRSIDAAKVSKSIYTHNADLLMLILAFVRRHQVDGSLLLRRQHKTAGLAFDGVLSLAIFLMNVGFQERHLDRNSVVTGYIHSVITTLINVLRKSRHKC
jgi:hypothetical protein